jgi:hypothetical protein
VHSANGIWFTPAQSNPLTTLGVAVTDSFGTDVVESPTVDDVAATVGGGWENESAPIPQAANRIRENRSANESAIPGIGQDWKCLLISIHPSYQAFFTKIFQPRKF